MHMLSFCHVTTRMVVALLLLICSFLIAAFIGNAVAATGLERASLYESGIQLFQVKEDVEEEHRRRLWGTKQQQQQQQQQFEIEKSTSLKRKRELSEDPSTLPPDPSSSKGSCIFTNAFTNTETCTQYHGESWTNTVDMEISCATASDNTGIFTSDIACTDENLAGWCAIDVNGDGDGTKGIYTLLSLSPMADCAGNEMACTTWVEGGVFIPDGACSDEEADGEEEGIVGVDDDDTLATIMAYPIMKGSCTYKYTISNGTTCFEFRGEEWTKEDMTNRCALGGADGDGESDGSATTTNNTGGGILSTTAGSMGCTTLSSETAASEVVAGYCDETIDNGKHEVTVMYITDGADCTANELVCTAYKGGVFGPDIACGGGGGGDTTATTNTISSAEAYEELASALSSEIMIDDVVASSLSQLDIPGANDDAVGNNGEFLGSEVSIYAPTGNNGDKVTVVAFDDDEMLTTMGGPDYPINGVDAMYVDVEGTSLLGYLSLPAKKPVNATAANVKIPAVIVIHGQDGISLYEKQRASILSSSDLGYVGFAADVYGIDAILPPPDADFMEKAVFTSTYTGNATLFTQRIQAAIDYVSNLEEVDENKVAIIGYCFGGIGVVHYLNTRGSSTGTEDDTTNNPALLAGAIAYHPTLLEPLPGPIGQIDIPSLFLTGGADFLNGPETMTKLELDMVGAPSLATWETVRYGGIGHAWTNWFNADMYNPRADVRSWYSGMTFLKTVFDIVNDDGFDDMPPSEVDNSNDGYYAYNIDDSGGIIENTALQGYASWPKRVDTIPLLPVVIILHFNLSSAQLIATQVADNLGYVAFVADLESEDICRANTTKYLSLITAAINHVKDMRFVDPTRLALMGFDYGGNGALYYSMLTKETNFDTSVKAIASFHGELDLVAAETLSLTTDLASSTGGGGESGEFDWSGMGGGGTSGEEFDWTTMSDGDGSSGFDFDSNNTGTRNLEIAAEKGYTTTSDSKPQILILSGVEGDDMTNVLVVEQTLIALNANHEISRFSHTSGSFTTWGSTAYNQHSSIRSKDQWKSVLSEVFQPFVISTPPPSATSEPSMDSSKSTLTCGVSVLVGSIMLVAWTVITL